MKQSLVILCALHLIGDALILWLGYVWLGIPESNTGHLVSSALLLLLFAGSALWLHGTAFAYFARPSDLSNAMVWAWRRLPVLFLLAVVAVTLYVLIDKLSQYLNQPAFHLASWLTLKLRAPVPPARVLAVFHGIVWLLEWLVLPALLVPIAAEGGFRRVRLVPSLQIFVLLLGAVWVPMKILAWIPDVPNFTAEMASFLARAGVAYLLFTGLLLVLEWVTASGRPSRTQNSTSAMP